MPITPYASTDQLIAWLDVEPPANEDSLRRSATIVVARACNQSPYGSADPTDGPLADATCAQVASWVALGVDPAKGGLDLPGPAKMSKMLDARVERDTAAATKLIESYADDGLCTEAEMILRSAGLLWLGDFEIADAGGCFAEAVELPLRDFGAWPFI